MFELLLGSPLTMFLVASTIIVHVGAALGVHRAIRRAARSEAQEAEDNSKPAPPLSPKA